jgi:hypothetical protein
MSSRVRCVAPWAVRTVMCNFTSITKRHNLLADQMTQKIFKRFVESVICPSTGLRKKE